MVQADMALRDAAMALADDDHVGVMAALRQKDVVIDVMQGK